MKTFLVHADSWHLIALITVYVLSDDVRGGYASGLHWQDHAHSVVNIHAWLDTTKAKVIILDSRENRGDTNPPPPLPSEGPHIQVSECPHLLLDAEHPSCHPDGPAAIRIPDCPQEEQPEHESAHCQPLRAWWHTVLQRADRRRLRRVIKAPEDCWGPSARLLLPQSNTRHEGQSGTVAGSHLLPPCQGLQVKQS